MSDQPATPLTFDRICPFCRVRWTGNARQLDCPQCQCNSFLTMNAGDIGTCMQLEAANLTLNDFKSVVYKDHQQACRSPGDAR